MPFVLDNSVAIGWYFENQATAYTDGALLIAAKAAGVGVVEV